MEKPMQHASETLETANEQERKRLEETENTVEKTAEKTFSQDDVNEIVQKRLMRDREVRSVAGGAGRLAEELAHREESLLLRERKLATKERLVAMSLPTEAADLLDYSDDETIEKSLATVKSLLQKTEQYAVDRILRANAWAPEKSPAQVKSATDSLRNVFFHQ